MNHSAQIQTILQDYDLTGELDEMWLDDNRLQPHWQPLVNALERLGPANLMRSQQEAHRHLRDNGVTYNVHGQPHHRQRDWALDVLPFIISETDWQEIEAGMVQRATLLNLILSDIYGPQTLIKEGRLPVELIYSHSGFLRQCHNITLPNNQPLITYAADLARGPDRRMWVLSDRTQAPSGAGYALENRTVMARVFSGLFRENNISRLSNYFRDFQSALANLSRRDSKTPRVVVLTPGPHNETYFEHAYLASYLGYPLVQGDDLTVRNGAVALKSLDGLQPVDVILRRVDDQFCDPLELREDSQLGVAGLVEAARRQNVTIVNPLGSSVLENPGLMPFLPGLARHFLGQDLRLPSAATWWCGQPKELSYVLANLPRLVIKKLSRQPQSRTIFGAQLTQEELAQLQAQIKAQPHLYVGQEPVSFSTVPALVDGRLQARHTVLRSFAVAKEQSYSVMPGGLTRSAPRQDTVVVSNQAGGISKDTWVFTSQLQPHISLWLQADQLERALRHSYHLPSRAAENLFWVGRYAERAEAAARMLRLILTYVGQGEVYTDAVEAEALPHLLRALTQVTVTYPGFVGQNSQLLLANPADELLSVTLAGDRPGSLLANLRSMLTAAYTVRDLWSVDSWRVVSDIEQPWLKLQQEEAITLNLVSSRLNQTITALMAFAGLNTESMTHEAGWLLLDIGRRLERSLLTIALIRATLVGKYQEPVERVLLDGVLRITENVITYRRRYRSYLHSQTVLNLLLLDPPNPRSLFYQLSQLQTHIEQLPRERTAAYRLSEEERLILEAFTHLRLVDTAHLAAAPSHEALRQPLDDFLAQVSAQLGQLAQVITQNYFAHIQTPHRRISEIQPEILPDNSLRAA